MTYLLDTCAVSELIKKTPSRKVVKWIDAIPEHILFLSVITRGEIQKGIDKLKDFHREKKLRHWLQTDLIKRFEGRLLEINREIALRWGGIEAKSERIGQKIPVIDGLIAATALTHDLVLVTRNIQDVQASGVKIFNP